MATHNCPDQPNLNLSIEQLEGSNWGNVPSREDTSYVIFRSLSLRKVPLKYLTLEDLRMALSQQIGLQYVIPIVLKKLHGDPTMEVTFYPGDILRALLDVPPDLWDQNNDWRASANELAIAFFAAAENDPEITCDTVALIHESHERFLCVREPKRWIR